MKEWEKFVLNQEKILGKEVVNNWLRTLKLVKFDACNIYLEALNPIQKAWFEEHIRPKLLNFKNNNGRLIKVHLDGSDKPKFIDPIQDCLDPHATFQNFIPSKQNELAYKLLSELNETNLASFNPLFIYGKEKSGKTHLLTATATALKKLNLKVFFINARMFTEHVVNAIRSGKMDLFRSTYRNIDILIMDDIHILANKIATQEEFFHTFNTLHMAKKQIILSANVIPGKLPQIEERLISRFEWGITIPLEEPDEKAIAQIIKSKFNNFGINVETDLISFLIQKFKLVPVIYKALNELLLKIHLYPNGLKDRLLGDAKTSQFEDCELSESGISSISKETALSYLKDFIREEEKNKITAKQIIEITASKFKVPYESIVGRSQTKECVIPRQISMYLCRKHLKIPFIQISKLFNRDHSTVMSSVKQIQQDLLLNPNLQKSIEEMENQILM